MLVVGIVQRVLVIFQSSALSQFKKKKKRQKERS